MILRGRAKWRYVLSVALVIALTLAAPTSVSASGYLKTVYPGGFAIAMELDIDGAVIDEVGFVNTAAGNATLSNKLRRGDMITEIDGDKISGCDDVLKKVEGGTGEAITLTIMRGGKETKISVTPYIDGNSGLYKLGIYIRDTVSGVGTVTYVKKNGVFAALGHKIVDTVADDVPISGGKVYNCELLGVIKGKRNSPGEIRAAIKGDPIGEVYANTEYGIFGRFYSFSPSSDPTEWLDRSEVSPGKAYILSDISGKVDIYEIEIIKANNQNAPLGKSMLIRITDKRLLELSGGIIQGMSGSPLLIDGKLAGAVTHVLINDPTKGYAIYTDWMKSA